MKKEELYGLHVFDGTTDYLIDEFDRGTKCFNAYVMEYDDNTDTFVKTDVWHRLTINEVEEAYENDYGKKIKIEL